MQFVSGNFMSLTATLILIRLSLPANIKTLSDIALHFYDVFKTGCRPESEALTRPDSHVKQLI